MWRGGERVRLVERDFKLLHEVGRWKFMLGRHIKDLCGFTSVSACDKRLKDLIVAGYLERKKYIYGVPGLYTLTHKGRILTGYNKRAENIRIDKIYHDICVLDSLSWFIKTSNISLENITSERELHSNDGFGVSKHYPDFVVTASGKKYAVEIEMSLKEKRRFEKNIQNNYMNYDGQVWVVPKTQKKIARILNENKAVYSGIKVYFLEELR